MSRFAYHARATQTSALGGRVLCGICCVAFAGRRGDPLGFFLVLLPLVLFCWCVCVFNFAVLPRFFVCIFHLFKFEAFWIMRDGSREVDGATWVSGAADCLYRCDYFLCETPFTLFTVSCAFPIVSKPPNWHEKREYAPKPHLNRYLQVGVLCRWRFLTTKRRGAFSSSCWSIAIAACALRGPSRLRHLSHIRPRCRRPPLQPLRSAASFVRSVRVAVGDST